jgi:hypothetical protein
LSVGSSAATVTWTSEQIGDGATFLLELGRNPGATDVGTYDAGSSLSYTVPNLPTARLYARVRSKIGEAISAPSSEIFVYAFSLRDYIEALFLGSGPAAQTSSPGCAASERRVGFPDGSTVTVRTSNTLTAEQLATVHAFVNRLPEVTLGRLKGRVEETNSSNPSAGRNQTAIRAGDPTEMGCPPGAVGCAASNQQPAGVIQYSRVLVRTSAPPAIIAHELGHAVLGLCHIQPGVIGGNRFSVMTSASSNSPHGLSEYDVTAVRAVHGTGVKPGDPRRAFLAAGLINTAASTLFSVPAIRSSDGLLQVTIED